MRRLTLSDADHGRIRSRLLELKNLYFDVAHTTAPIQSSIREANRKELEEVGTLLKLFDSAEIV
jgi:hypothetical protein